MGVVGCIVVLQATPELIAVAPSLRTAASPLCLARLILVVSLNPGFVLPDHRPSSQI